MGGAGGGDEWIYVLSKQEDAEAEQAVTAEEKAVVEDAETVQAVTNTDAGTAVGQGHTHTLEGLDMIEKTFEMNKVMEDMDRARDRFFGKRDHLKKLQLEADETYKALTAAEAAWEAALDRLQAAKKVDELEFDRAERAFEELCERRRHFPKDDGGAAASSDTAGGGRAGLPRDMLENPYDEDRYDPLRPFVSYYGNGFDYPGAYSSRSPATGLGNGAFPGGAYGPATGSSGYGYYGGYADPYQAPPPALFGSSSLYPPPPPQPRPYVYVPAAYVPSSSSLGPFSEPYPLPPPQQPRPYMYVAPAAPAAYLPSSSSSSSLGPFSKPYPPAVAPTMQPLEPSMELPSFSNYSFS